jgi:hypothetical protein
MVVLEGSTLRVSPQYVSAPTLQPLPTLRKRNSQGPDGQAIFPGHDPSTRLKSQPMSSSLPKSHHFKRPKWMDPDPLARSTIRLNADFPRRCSPHLPDDIAHRLSEHSTDLFTPLAGASVGLPRDDPRILREILDALNYFDAFCTPAQERCSSSSSSSSSLSKTTWPHQ